MRWQEQSQETRLKIVAVALAIVGFASAIAIYVVASAPAPNPLGEPDDSKQYLREMEVYGGTANLLADDLRRWFVGLWHGKSLAYTVATLTAVAALLLLYVATHLPDPDEPSETAGSDGDSGPG